MCTAGLKKTDDSVDNSSGVFELDELYWFIERRAPEAAIYCSDGWNGYVDVVYPGRYVRNTHNKSDTFTVEGVNAHLRTYIPILARRSRCFARKLDTLYAVMDVFVEAYNRFGLAKHRYRLTHQTGEVPFALVDFF